MQGEGGTFLKKSSSLPLHPHPLQKTFEVGGGVYVFRRGVERRAPQTRRVSFCQVFSFALLCPKEKAYDSFLLIKRTVEDACPYG